MKDKDLMVKMSRACTIYGEYVYKDLGSQTKNLRSQAKEEGDVNIKAEFALKIWSIIKAEISYVYGIKNNNRKKKAIIIEEKCCEFKKKLMFQKQGDKIIFQNPATLHPSIKSLIKRLYLFMGGREKKMPGFFKGRDTVLKELSKLSSISNVENPFFYEVIEIDDFCNKLSVK